MTDTLIVEALQKMGLGVHAADGERVDLPRLEDSLRVNCMPCAHASIFGWWGPPLVKDIGATTHCKRCHRSWRSVKEAHCTVCCHQFASNEAAAYHWVDDKHIMPEDVVRAKKVGGGPRYFSTETEWGPVWALARHLEYREGTS